MNEQPPRVMRQVSANQDKIIRILDALHSATVENIKLKDGQIRRLEVRLIIDFDDPTAFKRAIDELKTIPL